MAMDSAVVMEAGQTAGWKALVERMSEVVAKERTSVETIVERNIVDSADLRYMMGLEDRANSQVYEDHVEVDELALSHGPQLV
jgi:hypothetical protein